VRLKPTSLLFAPSQRINSEKVVQDGQKAMANIAVIASHNLNRSFIVSS
jgi:hypothetical protein